MKDKSPVGYPKGTSYKDRAFVRNVINIVRDHIAQNIPSGDTIAVSCSAGVDSICLADILYRIWRVSKANTICVLHVNHGLRPDENLIEHALLTTFCRDRNINLCILDGQIKKGKGLQDRARGVRYEALYDKCVEFGFGNLFVAHNKNDVIEGMMIKLFQGRISTITNQSVVYGVAPTRTQHHKNKAIIVSRPLLQFTRKDIERYAKVMKIEWHEDSSNKSDDYLRNYIRHNVIPHTFLGDKQ